MPGTRSVGAVLRVLCVATIVAAGSVAPPGATATTSVATATTPVGSLPSAAPLPAPVQASSAIVPGTANRSSIAMWATYAVDVRLGIAARTLRGRVTITAQNRSGGNVDRLRLNTVMGPLGGLRLGTVTVDGAARAASVDDQTITVPLGGVLPDGATVVVVVPFSATLRSSTGGSRWLFTRANGITSMYRWVPWISRNTRFDRPNHGDPFVTPVSPRVTLRIHTDAPVRLVVNGTRTSRSADGLTSTYEAVNVRDLVVSAAADFRTRQAVVGDTSVRVITRPGAPGAAILSAATTALRRLEGRLGPYPWPVLRIVQSSGGYGMEGPGIVWIPGGVAPSNLPYLVTHEIAHQWFYGLVGNDQAREPFADEAVTDMVARYVLGLRRGSRCATATLDRSIYRYSATCYYEIVYIQGGNLLDDARRRMGTSAYFSAVRRYLADHRWGLVHTRTLLDALDAATPFDLRSRWSSRFPSLY
jgi:hypothetical protein